MDHLSSANWFSATAMDGAAFVNDQYWMCSTVEDIVDFCPNNPLFPPDSSTTTNTGFDQMQGHGCNIIHREHSLNSDSTSASAISPKLTNGGFEKIKNLKAPTKTEMGNTIISFMSYSHGEQDNNDRIEFEGKKGCTNSTRSPLQAQDHVLAERMRRQKLTQRFIALSALIPGLKKLDKASVLGDAIKYIKELQERVETLEKQTNNNKRNNNGNMESSTVRVTAASCHDDDSSSLSDGGGDDNLEVGGRELPEIEVRVSGEDLLIRIHYCNDNQGLVIKKIYREMERLHLTINTSQTMPFGNTTYITIVAQMDKEFSMEAKDVAHNIRTTIVKLMRHGECI